MRRSELRALAVFAGLLSLSPESRAGGPLGEDGEPLRTSEYAIDLFQGPVLAGTRVTGLSGAYVAISEEVDGDLQNPATPAVRPFFSYSYFDYWLGFGLTFPGSLQDVDFFNSGRRLENQSETNSFVFFSPAVNLQWGELGVGITLEAQRYEIVGTNRDASIVVTIPTTHLQFAHGFSHNQLVVGLGARLLSMSVVQKAETRTRLFESSGSGLEFGMVYKPEHLPLRLGLAYRTGIRTENEYRAGLLPNQDGDLVVPSPNGNLIFLPKAVALPWDFNFGFVVQFGKRPLNMPWRTSGEMIEREQLVHRLRRFDRERARAEALRRARSAEEAARLDRQFSEEQEADNRLLERQLRDAVRRHEGELGRMNRFYVQLAGSMLVSGTVTDGVGVESLQSRTVQRSGERTVASPRMGVEIGVVPEWFKLRAGSYLEPSRFETSSPRVHGTFGLDLKLFPWNVFGLWPPDYVWRLGLGADVADRYNSWGVTIGGWYPRHDRAPTPTGQ